ncbi:MAG TPA: hypothetical protein PLP71_02605, partial [Syntrophomonadaceae bacterium]|nr:hypothetical protein [Syntrophomonadaceae bacterium]
RVTAEKGETSPSWPGDVSYSRGGGNLESVCGYELACGESHSKFFNVIVITFTNKVNAQKPIITAFAHKRCF